MGNNEVSITIEAEAFIELTCKICGASFLNIIPTNKYVLEKRKLSIQIIPCAKCQTRAFEDGRKEGFKDATKDERVGKDEVFLKSMETQISEFLNGYRRE